MSWQELSEGTAVEKLPSLRQLFLVFDADGDSGLGPTEFRGMPMFRSGERVVTDPLLEERDKFLSEIEKFLAAADLNRDGRWDRTEWPSQWDRIGLEPVEGTHSAWDLDRDGQVTREEIRRGADQAYGLVDPIEGPIPSPARPGLPDCDFFRRKSG